MEIALIELFNKIINPFEKIILVDGNIMPEFKKNFAILGSAHNINEIRCKEAQNVGLIFISSIFKKNKNHLGFYKFINLKRKTYKNVVALGGINRKNVKKLSLTKCFGFAGISYFE